MAKIRVLVVDDSVVIRKIVTEALSADPNIEIVGTASNGRIALSKIPQVNPDLVTLDIEMPELDGLGALKEIRKSYHTLPVVMFSTLTERGAMATLDALALGASDYVTKPSNMGSVVAAQERIRADLIPKIHALCWRVSGTATSTAAASGVAPRAPLSASTIVRPATAAPRLQQRIDMITIGVSTGGPNALAEVLPALPGNLPVPVVIVQHMPPVFTKLLADRLQSICALKVQEATAGTTIQAGSVYIAPGNFHMVVGGVPGALRIDLNQAPPENSCRPAADVLFKSVAQHVGANTLGVVLTGMGKDGLRGAQLIVDAGGAVLAQDQNSSVVWGMPGFVAQAGLADRVLPLSQIAAEIVKRVQFQRNDSRRSATGTIPHFANSR